MDLVFAFSSLPEVINMQIFCCTLVRMVRLSLIKGETNFTNTSFCYYEETIETQHANG